MRRSGRAARKRSRKPGQCSIGRVKHRGAWIAGIGVAGAAAWRLVTRRRKRTDGPDPRAEELRRHLEESRSLVEEQEEFEEAETPIDRADLPSEGLDERRRAVHEHGRAAIDELRSQPPAE